MCPRISVAALALLGACGHYSFERAAGDAAADGMNGTTPDVTDAALRVGLEVWLECESISGGVPDSSGNGSSATCSPGQCPTLVSGPRGMACLFDGNDDVVAVAPDARFQSATFSVAVWLRVDLQTSGYHAAWVKHAVSDSFEVWAVFAHSDMFADRLIAGGDSNTDAYGELGGFILGDWTHAALTYDGTTDVFRCYRDGTLTQSIGGVLVSDVTRELLLGAEGDPGVRISHWPGALDDARLYSRVLSDAEIAALAAP